MLTRSEYEFLYALAAGAPIINPTAARSVGRARLACWCDIHERWEITQAGFDAIGVRPLLTCETTT